MERANLEQFLAWDTSLVMPVFNTIAYGRGRRPVPAATRPEHGKLSGIAVCAAKPGHEAVAPNSQHACCALAAPQWQAAICTHRDCFRDWSKPERKMNWCCMNLHVEFFCLV
jgi:hypothetical protein